MSESYPYSVNYSGRQVDIEMLQSIARPVEIERVTISSVTDTPKIVAGVQKLVQRYALLLLSTVETIHFDEEQGASLISSLLGGIVQNRGRLQNIFGLANNRVRQQLNKDDLQTEVFGTVPDDERLKSAILLDFDVDTANSLVYLRVKLITVAGTSLEFIVPTTAPR